MILGVSGLRPTGRWRHRCERQWGRERLILQLEEQGRLTRLLGPYPDTVEVVRWRDATPEDLTVSATPQPAAGAAG